MSWQDDTSGAGGTNLSIANRTGTTLDVASSTGTDATIPAASGSEAGLMTDAQYTKLDGIEANGATADQTASEIKTAYESNPNTNAFDDTEQTKLAGIEAGAQVNVGTDLSIGTHTGTSIEIDSSTGADVAIPSATTTEAGVLNATDKTKLRCTLSKQTNPRRRYDGASPQERILLLITMYHGKTTQVAGAAVRRMRTNWLLMLPISVMLSPTR